MVIWGGTIVTAKNLKEGTLFEIVQKPLNVEERPLNVDRSDGRFLALYDGYLDVAIYSTGREVTVAGRIKKTKSIIYLPTGVIPTGIITPTGVILSPSND